MLGMQAAGSSTPAMASLPPLVPGACLSVGEFEATSIHAAAVRLAMQEQRRVEWHVVLTYLASTAACGLLLAAATFWFSQTDMTTGRLIGIGGFIASAAVPVIAVTLAMPYWRATGMWMLVILVVAVLTVLASMAIRLAREVEFDAS